MAMAATATATATIQVMIRRLMKRHAMVTPPSITMACPVMNAPAFEARNTAAPAISSGSPQRRIRGGAFQDFGVLPQRAGKIGLDQARRDTVGADVVRPVFHRDVACQLK